MVETPVIQCSLTTLKTGLKRLACLVGVEKNASLIGISTVLFARQFNITRAWSQVSDNADIEHIFDFQTPLKEIDLNELQKDISAILREEITPIAYLQNYKERLDLLLEARQISPKILLKNLPGRDYTLCQVIRADRPGLLMQISQVLEVLDFDILAFTAYSEEGVIYDTFKIAHKGGDPISLEQSEIITQLLNRQLTF